MSRKTGPDSHNGFNDVIGVALLAVALLLLVAQLSFDRYDLSFFRDPHNKPIHNWIGPMGAYLAWGSFLPLGLVGYLLPWLLAAFGAAYLLNFLGYLRERLNWSLLWSAMLILSLTGLLYIIDDGGRRGKLHEIIGAQSIGGWLGFATYGQTENYNYGFSLLGSLGAIIVYAALCLISLLFLTNFRLGEWIRAFVDNKSEPVAAEKKSPEEIVLERRARDLEKQAKKLQDEVIEVTRSGLGADGLPVPEPTVRDLSVPQAKGVTGARVRKTTLPEPKIPVAPEPADEVEVIPAKEIVAATTAEILGKKPDEEKPLKKKRKRQLPKPLTRKSRPRKKLSRKLKSPGSRRPETVCRANRSPWPSPACRSSAITNCRRWNFSSTRT